MLFWQAKETARALNKLRKQWPPKLRSDFHTRICREVQDLLPQRDQGPNPLPCLRTIYPAHPMRGLSRRPKEVPRETSASRVLKNEGTGSFETTD